MALDAWAGPALGCGSSSALNEASQAVSSATDESTGATRGCTGAAAAVAL